ncbi:hypothetical protein ABH930_000284 [Kitasatospora sp. GAS204A]|uniref:hypothetical protein n=1 Tax=unclassified Kitasatospora TaxID=2633591 RepID=UPI0024766D81|nr:hypothetical protein [Kitasatospora sp. GAS204B]MDH6116865.1 hypothetical protein [Kitasatospora sp. GAS204B]
MTTAPLSDEQYAAIRAREAAATKGPWWADSHEIYSGPHDIPGLGEWVAETCVADELERSEANAHFVASARTDVPALLAEVDRLRAERDQARARLATVEAAEGAARAAMEAILLVPDRDPDAADSSPEWHARIGYNDALSDVRDAIGTTAFEPRPTRDQVLAEAADHLDRIADETEAQVAAHYGHSGIGPGSADMVRECARTLRGLAADAPHPN